LLDGAVVRVGSRVVALGVIRVVCGRGGRVGLRGLPVVGEERAGDGVADGALADADAHLGEHESCEEPGFGRVRAVEQAEQAVASRALAPAARRGRHRLQLRADLGDGEVLAPASAERAQSLLAAEVERGGDRTDLADLGEAVLDVSRVDVRVGGARERLVTQRRPDCERPVVPRRERSALHESRDGRKVVVGVREQRRDGRDDREVRVGLLDGQCPVGERGELHRIPLQTGGQKASRLRSGRRRWRVIGLLSSATLAPRMKDEEEIREQYEFLAEQLEDEEMNHEGVRQMFTYYKRAIGWVLDEEHM